MGMVLFALFLLPPQLVPGAPTQPVAAPVRTEKLTPSELQQYTDAKTAVAAAQAKLDLAKQVGGNDDAATKTSLDQAQAKLGQAKRELQGAEDGISLAHHANTECGCYVQSQGRDYDKVEFKDDAIVIRHVHEGPPTLH